MTSRKRPFYPRETVEAVARYRQDDFAFHETDWNAKSIPVSRDTLAKYLPKDISLEELEIIQFKLSKDNGRVHGFFDEKGVFCVVWLDPMHNLQPSKAVNWRVRPTGILKHEIDVHKSEMMRLQKYVSDGCSEKSCEVRETLAKLLKVDPSHKYVCVDQLLQKELDDIYDLGKHPSVDDILVDAVAEYQEKYCSERTKAC